MSEAGEQKRGKILAALHEFVDAITVTGGVFRNGKGLHEPFADREWIDLGEAYVNACEVLGIQAVVYPKVYFDDEVEPPEQWCVELDDGKRMLYRFSSEEMARRFADSEAAGDHEKHSDCDCVGCDICGFHCVPGCSSGMGVECESGWNTQTD